MAHKVGANGIAVGSFISGLRIVFIISFAFSIFAAILSYMRGPAPVWNEVELENAN